MAGWHGLCHLLRDHPTLTSHLSPPPSGRGPFLPFTRLCRFQTLVGGPSLAFLIRTLPRNPSCPLHESHLPTPRHPGEAFRAVWVSA